MPYFSATPIFSFVAAAAAETGSSVVEVAVDVPLRPAPLADEAAAADADAVPIRTIPPVDEADDEVDVSIRSAAPVNEADHIRNAGCRGSLASLSWCSRRCFTSTSSIPKWCCGTTMANCLLHGSKFSRNCSSAKSILVLGHSRGCYKNEYASSEIRSFGR